MPVWATLPDVSLPVSVGWENTLILNLKYAHTRE
jgi:hypothetical protein